METIPQQLPLMSEAHIHMLQESTSPVRALLDSLPEVILVYDTKGSILYVNGVGAAWLAWSVEELIGKSLREIVTPASLPQAFIQASAEHDAAQPCHAMVYVTRIGQYLTAEVHTSPLEFEGTRALLAIVRDTTERTRQETQRQQAQKMQAIGTFAGGIAQDFNNCLAAIMGYSELALDDVPPGSPLEHYLTSVLTAGQRACNLVQQVLLFSRQRLPQREPVHLHVVFGKVLAKLRERLPATIALQLRLQSTIGAVLADPAQLQQVLMHLCTNAEHAMRDKGGVLEVSLDSAEVLPHTTAAPLSLTPGLYVRLQVRDTGHGMAPDILERIFEPFFTTKIVGEGTGMGLAIVDGVVTNHGGAITVVSTPGEGTTFTVYLPRLELAASAFAAPSLSPGLMAMGVSPCPL
jgi:PAS domain S-box-containing protein